MTLEKLSEDTYAKLLSRVIETVQNRRDDIPNVSDDTLANQLKLFAFFLKKSFEEDKKEKLNEFLPWMYHAYFGQGITYDFFLDEYEAWILSVDEIVDQADATRLLSLLKQLQHNHQTFIARSKRYQSLVEETHPLWIECKKQFRDALIKGETQKCNEIFDARVSNFEQLQLFFQYVIVPAMREIGVAWENAEVTPAQEHLASSIVMEILTRIYLKIDRPTTNKGNAIVTTVTNEFHEIGAFMLSDSLEADGWNVIYLGCNASQEQLFDEIKAHKPIFVALSVSIAYNIPNAISIINAIRYQKDHSVPKIMVGGSAFELLEPDENPCNADSYLHNIGEGLDQANKWYLEALDE